MPRSDCIAFHKLHFNAHIFSSTPNAQFFGVGGVVVVVAGEGGHMTGWEESRVKRGNNSVVFHRFNVSRQAHLPLSLHAQVAPRRASHSSVACDVRTT